MNTNEFIEKVRGLVLNNAELNKAAMEFFGEHPECWASSKYDENLKLVCLNIGIHFHAPDKLIKEARPWFSIDFGYSDAELKYSETLHDRQANPGVYKCYVFGSTGAITLKNKVNW